MRRKTGVFFVGICMLYACQSGHPALIGNQLEIVATPPNMVKVGENLYADKTELSNIDWLEYLYWQMRVHGPESPQYLTALPDTMVWREKEPSYGEPHMQSYLRHPAYHNFPIVGISYEQAQSYCEWRTDRVTEMMLIQKGLLDGAVSSMERQPLFTLERYRRGEYSKPSLAPPIPLPVFRLPTEAEWQHLAAAGLDPQWYPQGVDATQFSRKEKKKYKNGVLFHTKNEFPHHFSLHSRPSHLSPVSTNSFLPNAFGIYNAIGNVAEMVEEEGIAKGGSFIHSAKESAILEQQTYMFPNYWLGFRCVATQELITLIPATDEGQQTK